MGRHDLREFSRREELDPLRKRASTSVHGSFTSSWEVAVVGVGVADTFSLCSWVHGVDPVGEKICLWQLASMQDNTNRSHVPQIRPGCIFRSHFALKTRRALGSTLDGGSRVMTSKDHHNGDQLPDHPRCVLACQPTCNACTPSPHVPGRWNISTEQRPDNRSQIICCTPPREVGQLTDADLRKPNSDWRLDTRKFSSCENTFWVLGRT